MYQFMSRNNKERGFTLVEMLLVLVIVSALIMAGFNYFQQKTMQNKIDKTALEMQQILTAAMTFYVAKGVWPDADSNASADIIACLQGNGATFGKAPSTTTCDLALLPNTATAPSAPWMDDKGVLTPYSVAANVAAGDPKFYVYVSIEPKANRNNDVSAKMIANKMPLGYASDSASGIPPAAPVDCKATTACAAIASVMPPAQNLVNAGNVTYAGAYKHGGCIPVPTCPIDPSTQKQLVPQVFVVPSSISGFSDMSGSTHNIVPITSFTAYATQPAANPAACKTVGTVTVPDCSKDPKITNPAASSWRACVDIQTQLSPTNITDTSWSQYVSVVAFTRCAPPAEKTGGGFNLYETDN